jgi:hypothetical protein
MGMFDDIRCEYPLPGNAPANATEIWFQTKDLDCQMHTFAITAKGALLDSSGETVDYTGAVNFYKNNVVCSGPGTYTRNGEPAHFLEYQALFEDGKLLSIRETENRKEPAVAVKYSHIGDEPPTREEIESARQSEEESLIGRTMYVWWGGRESGYSVKVIAENGTHWVCQDENGKFEIIGRYQRGSTFFDSEEDGQRYNDKRKARWEQKRKAYEEQLAKAATDIKNE